MMKILITGSNGFIGKWTVSSALCRGHDVVAVDKLEYTSTLIHNNQNLLATVCMDITNAPLLLRLFEYERPDAVIHLAANSSVFKSMNNALYDAHNNILGTVAVLGACQRTKVAKIVFASTSAVYASSNSNIRESFTKHPISPYGVGKLAAEYYVQTSGIPYAILRYGNVYGLGQKAVGENQLMARAIDHIKFGKQFLVNGAGTQKRDWVFVEDIADLNMLTAKSPISGIWNAATGQGATVNQVVGMIGKELNWNKGWTHGPPKKGDADRVVLNCEKIRKELGWTASMRLRDGIKLTV